ncbi:MAG TPA: hypothetical protein VHT04_18970 [Stellaceae bacterium]|nr:hypothetical protein [Stellaceae bacterium]
MNDANFAKGPAHFFDGAPDTVQQQARDGMRAALHAQGIGAPLSGAAESRPR